MPITLYDNGNHKCIVFADLVECGDDESKDEGAACDSVQSNQFLIVHNEHAALVEPGGHLTYTRLFIGISGYVFPKNLDYVIASH